MVCTDVETHHVKENGFTLYGSRSHAAVRSGESRHFVIVSRHSDLFTYIMFSDHIQQIYYIKHFSNYKRLKGWKHIHDSNSSDKLDKIPIC